MFSAVEIFRWFVLHVHENVSGFVMGRRLQQLHNDEQRSTFLDRFYRRISIYRTGINRLEIGLRKRFSLYRPSENEQFVDRRRETLNDTEDFSFSSRHLVLVERSAIKRNRSLSILGRQQPRYSGVWLWNSLVSEKHQCSNASAVRWTGFTTLRL